MPNNSSGADPQKIWQNQPPEPTPMTMEKIRLKVSELHAKTRRQMIGNSIVLLAAACAAVFGIARLHDSLLRTLLALAILWSVAGQFFLNRGMWSTMLPENAALRTGLEGYRHEVERRRSLSSRFLLWLFGPICFGVVTLIVILLHLGTSGGMDVPRTLLKMAPFLTLTVVWVLRLFVQRAREHRVLQREVEELNRIERSN
jgi:hypothetical protein